MSARSKSRKRALDVLYAADARGIDPQQVLAERADNPDAAPIGDYAEELVRGVAGHAERIDALIAERSEGWSLERMPAVDRAVLRIAVYELVYQSDVPAAVAVDEAVELAKTLSTDNSPRFVNGVLGQIVPIAGQLRGA